MESTFDDFCINVQELCTAEHFHACVSRMVWDRFEEWAEILTDPTDCRKLAETLAQCLRICPHLHGGQRNLWNIWLRHSLRNCSVDSDIDLAWNLFYQTVSPDSPESQVSLLTFQIKLEEGALLNINVSNCFSFTFVLLCLQFLLLVHFFHSFFITKRTRCVFFHTKQKFPEFTQPRKQLVLQGLRQFGEYYSFDLYAVAPATQEALVLMLKDSIVQVNDIFYSYFFLFFIHKIKLKTT